MRSRDTHGAHNALGDDGSWTVMVDNLNQTSPEGVNVLSLDGHDLEAMTFESLGEIVPFEVLGRAAGNGDAIVVDEEFYVEVLSDCKPSGLCVVTFLLRSIRTQAEDDLVTVGQSDTVDHGPHVSKTSGREFDPGGQTQFGMTGELRIGSTVVEEVLGGDSSLEGGEQVLGSNTVT